MRRARDRLTYANVVATIALFIAIGGASAFAASQLAKNSVGTKQLKKNSVTAAKIKKEAVTGAKIKLSTLGTVPTARTAITAGDASTLNGIPSSAFMRGGGQFFSARRRLAVGESEVPFLDLPGLAHVTAICAAGKSFSEGRFEFANDSGVNIEETLRYPEGVDGATIPSGQANGPGFNEYVGVWTVQLSTDATPSTIATVNLSFLKDENAGCFMFGQATVASG